MAEGRAAGWKEGRMAIDKDVVEMTFITVRGIPRALSADND